MNETINEEEQARVLIAQYEQHIAERDSSEVVARETLPENDEAEWRASFVDGHKVSFWISDHHTFLENNVRIVSREG